MYKVSQIIVSNTDPLYNYLDNYVHMAKLLYNASLFRIRQIFTGLGKDVFTDNEKEVLDEVAILERTYPSIHVKKVISYSHLEKLMRVTNNPDFFSGLPMQTSQQIIRQACTDFSNWLKALKKYMSNPGDFLGRPNMPGYKKSDICSFAITNQDAVLYSKRNKDGNASYCELKLPRTRERITLSNLTGDECLKEITVKPYYGRYILSLTFELKGTIAVSSASNMAGIDFGINNIAAIACTDGSSVIYKGGALLSDNQKFAKLRSKYVGIITKGHNHKYASSKRLSNISFHHANFTKDQLHKISTSIINWCVNHEVGTLVLGENRNWKQESNIGTVNNQIFVAFPITWLRELIIYKAKAQGINVIVQEESYTSKADITAFDFIPTYGVNDEEASFSGKRIRRGLYRCSNGLLINADCNAAANILRKAIPYAWDTAESFDFLVSPDVLGFHELNPKSIA